MKIPFDTDFALRAENRGRQIDRQADRQTEKKREGEEGARKIFFEKQTDRILSLLFHSIFLFINPDTSTKR